MIYSHRTALDFAPGTLPAVPLRRRVLMTSPDHFEVQYVINPHMEGHIGTVDRDLATRQWHALKRTYASLGLSVTSIPGVEGLPDMVFCANQTLPYYRSEPPLAGVVLSRMQAPERQPEVPHYEQFFGTQGYEITRLPDDTASFEGMGDALWHPGRHLLWGGYGFRSDLSAYEAIARLLDVRVLTLQLDDADFYHLDTCLSLLNTTTALLFPGAFQPEGLDLIRHFFDRLIEAPEDEARSLFACNAHCPDGTHVLIQRGCEQTMRRLCDAGFTPLPVDTSEFIKAGGSVFCMKQMIW